MENYIIWLDSEKAQLFALQPSGVKRSHVKKSGVDHHTRNKKDNPNDEHAEHFFKLVTEALSGADQLLIMGPGLAKNHFKTYLEKHHHAKLASQIIGMENSDHPTDNEILAAGRTYFKKYDLFHNPISE